MTKEYTCCFFGHREISDEKAVKVELFSLIEDLIINNGVYIFLFGSKGQFNDLCYSVVTELKNKYSNIMRIYVSTETPHIKDECYTDLLKHYEHTCCRKKKY